MHIHRARHRRGTARSPQ